MNTPSHHRVHHGMDPEYVDRNYAGIFIIWDRLFGTYEPETREPVYGTVKAVGDLEPARGEPGRTGRTSGRCPRRRSARRTRSACGSRPPSGAPADLGGPVAVPPADPAAHPRYDVRAPAGMQVYVAIQFAIVGVATMRTWGSSPRRRTRYLAACAAVFLVTLVAWGALLERRTWAWPLEVARLCAGVALAVIGIRGV